MAEVKKDRKISGQLKGGVLMFYKIILLWFLLDGMLLIFSKKFRQQRIIWLKKKDQE